MSDDPVGDAIRAARYAEAIMRRTAAPLWGDWQHDPSGESGSPNGRAETYRADITDDHHMTVFRKNPPPVYDDDDTDELGQAYAEAERLYPHPVNMDTPWSYHLHGVGHNDNPYLKFHTPYDDNPHHTGFPDRETAQRAAEAAYQTFAPGGHGPSAPDPDEEQDPFDPRLIGASLDTADIIRLAGDGMSWEDTMAHIDQVLAEGEPQEYNDGIEPVHSCDGCGVEPDDDRRVQHVQRGDSFLGAFCDSCIRNL